MTFIDPGNKLLGHLDRLAELAAGRTSAPINAEVDLSFRCSLGCKWCAFSHTHTRGPLTMRDKPQWLIPGGDLMDTELALSMIDQFVAAGVRSLSWTGGGEPTLHPDFNTIIEHAESAGIPQGIYTHAGHLDEKRAALLKRALTFVYASLDAVDAESYQREKGVDRFDAACEGIRRVARADGKATVGVGMLVGPHFSIDDVPRAAELAHELGADYVQFRPIVGFDVGSSGKANEGREWIPAMVEAIAATSKQYGNVESDAERFDIYRSWETHPYETCWWSLLQTVVTPDGSLWVCVNRREFPDSRLGSLAEESFDVIWARHTAFQVNGECRISCRGDIANRALDQIMSPREHAAFV